MYQVFVTNIRTKTQQVYNVTGIVQTMRLRLRLLASAFNGETVRVWNVKAKCFGIV